MQIIYILIFVLFFVVLFFPKRENATKFRKACKIFIVLLFLPFIVYAIGTVIIMNVKGYCFVGYYTVQKSQISYKDALYDRVTEEKEIDMLNDLDWTYINTEDFITLQPVRFPYFEYWMPHIFFDRLYIPVETKDYIVVTSLDGSSMYYELAQ